MSSRPPGVTYPSSWGLMTHVHAGNVEHTVCGRSVENKIETFGANLGFQSCKVHTLTKWHGQEHDEGQGERDDVAQTNTVPRNYVLGPAHRPEHEQCYGSHHGQSIQNVLNNPHIENSLTLVGWEAKIQAGSCAYLKIFSMMGLDKG